MKKLAILSILGVLILFTGCGDKKADKEPQKITIQSSNEVKKEKPAEASSNGESAELIAKGKKLFKDKTCFTCHMPYEKGIGPSISDINKIYSENNADIVAFLKGEIKPIVDTDPGQVAVMQANIDGFVKDLTDAELNALKVYMLSVK
jgi:cytochrome c